MSNNSHENVFHNLKQFLNFQKFFLKFYQNNWWVILYGKVETEKVFQFQP